MIKNFTFLLPIVLAVFGAGGWFLSYGIAVSNPQHVVSLPNWPTISNTGSFAPESCVFSQVFNMCAFMGFCMISIFYKYVQVKGAHGYLNTVCLYIGIIIMFGIMIVGNFQFVSIRVVHFIGAFMAFFGGIGYEWTSATLCLRYLETPKPLVAVRYLIAVLTTASISIMLYSGAVGPGSDRETFWANMVDGWEWTMGLLHLSYFSTLSYEFSKIDYLELKLHVETKTVNIETVSVKTRNSVISTVSESERIGVDL